MPDMYKCCSKPFLVVQLWCFL